MKRTCLLLVALALASCSIEPIHDESTDSGFRVESLRALLPQTRLALDETGMVAWTEGDDIAVHRSASGYETAPLTADGCFNVHLAGSEARDAFALYPARIADNTAASASNLRVILPSDYQIPTEGMAQLSPLPMIARNSPESEDIHFTHLGGVLRLSLDNIPYETASLRVSMGKRLTGSFSVSDPTGSTPSIAADTEEGEPVTFTLAVPSSEIRNGYVLNVPVPTGTYPSLSITAHDFHGNLLASASDTETRTFERAWGLRASLAMTMDVRSIPLAVKAMRTGVVTISNPLRKTIEYSKDMVSWTASSDNPISLPIDREESIYLRGNNASYATSQATNGSESTAKAASTIISCSNYCYVYGNIMSLVDAENFPNLTTLTGSYTFSNLFRGNTSLLNHPSLPLLLPATTLTDGCYASLFQGCTGLTEAPDLPATELKASCYYHLFYECRNLQAAPTLPATTMQSSCYSGMFYYCSSLTEAPELPAPTLANSCYNSMFYLCSSLRAAPALPATELKPACYDQMFRGCRSIQEAPELPATTLASSCYYFMFAGCSGLTTAPDLPATELASSCYAYMFDSCTNLVSAPELPATSMASSCYKNMFGYCSNLQTAPALPATNLASECYKEMFIRCNSLSMAPSLPATTLKENCYQSMFSYCTSLTTVPDLPAEELVSYCYYEMFNNCSNLNSVKAMFTTKPESLYTYNWLNGVASTGTFVKNAAATWNVTGANGIPSGWTVQTATN